MEGKVWQALAWAQGEERDCRDVQATVTDN